jgi:nucleotide-binding universal stress UspA family protein
MPEHIEPPIFERIVVGVDGGDGGRDALALAGLLQRAGGGELIAVHVHAYGHHVDLAHAEAVESAIVNAHLDRVEREVARAGLRAQPVAITENSPGRALHTVAERYDAQLIVVGACHLSGADRMLVGDDAAGTLHGSPCAVAVAPAGFARGDHGLRMIGVGVDDSPEARAALALARSLARRAGAPLRATTVVHHAQPFGAVSAWEPAWADYEPRAHESGQQLLDRILRDVDDEVTAEVAVGTPWQQLASRSADLDLLVLGARSFGPLRRLLLGSTSTKLARHARCPLLVLPGSAHRNGYTPRGSTMTGQADSAATRRETPPSSTARTGP